MFYMSISHYSFCRKIHSISGIGRFLNTSQLSFKGGEDYNSIMFNIYERVVKVGLPNFIGAHIPVHTNIIIGAWAKLAITPEDERV